MLSPLVGLGMEIYETVFSPEPHYMIVLAGLLMIGVPLDAFTALPIATLSRYPITATLVVAAHIIWFGSGR